MTTDERKMLTTYRQQGFGYKKIAQLTGLSVNTVKTYCKRNALGGEIASRDCRNMDKVCKCCGAPLVHTSGRKPKIFCSDTCRTKWWNTHPELVNHRDGRQVVCGHCRQVFSVSKNSSRKYCSHNCYIAERFHGGELQ